MLILHADISLPVCFLFATGMSSATISSLGAIRVPSLMFSSLSLLDIVS